MDIEQNQLGFNSKGSIGNRRSEKNDTLISANQTYQDIDIDDLGDDLSEEEDDGEEEEEDEKVVAGLGNELQVASGINSEMINDSEKRSLKKQKNEK